MMAELPELLYEDLQLDKEFPVLEYPITRELVDKFIDTTNDDNPLYNDEELCKEQGLLSTLAPTGLAGIFGRLSYLQHHRMPPGGILAKQEMQSGFGSGDAKIGFSLLSKIRALAFQMAH